MATVLGKTQDAETFNLLVTRVRDAFNNKFLNREEGYYVDRSQSAQTWPLLFGLVPEDQEKSVFNTLINDIVDIRDGHPSTGYVGTKFMLDLLTENDRQDIVWYMALKTDFPSWGYSLRNGRTTITEAWKDGGSQNHVVLGAAIDPWFYNTLAGIKMDEQFPGFKKFTIDPYVPDHDLDWVKSTINTIHGKIISSWKKGPNGLIIEVTVPPNTIARIHLPTSPGGSILEGKKRISRVKEIKFIDERTDATVVEVGSGEYSFLISN